MKGRSVMLWGGSVLCAGAANLEDPVPLKAGGELVRVEAPGYAAPCLGDVDGDGSKELLVGQFRGGKIQVFEKDGDSYAKGTWLEAEGKVAEVPGVW